MTKHGVNESAKMMTTTMMQKVTMKGAEHHQTPMTQKKRNRMMTIQPESHP